MATAVLAGLLGVGFVSWSHDSILAGLTGAGCWVGSVVVGEEVSSKLDSCVSLRLKSVRLGWA